MKGLTPRPPGFAPLTRLALRPNVFVPLARLSLLPHVFVAGGHPSARPTAYISARALRAAIAANAALMTFAGDDEAMRAPGGHDPFATPAAGSIAAPAQPRVSAPDRAA
jgi:hypothetical protein